MIFILSKLEDLLHNTLRSFVTKTVMSANQESGYHQSAKPVLIHLLQTSDCNIQVSRNDLRILFAIVVSVHKISDVDINLLETTAMTLRTSDSFLKIVFRPAEIHPLINPKYGMSPPIAGRSERDRVRSHVSRSLPCLFVGRTGYQIHSTS
jgi:hypothetical protein